MSVESSLLDQLGVGGAHDLPHPLGVVGEKARLELEAEALLDRAAHHPPQHVAAILVGGDHAVGREEGHRAGVVGEDAHRAVCLELLSVAPARELLTQLDQRQELVGLEHRLLLLKDRSHAVEAEARVDVAGRQRLQHGAAAVGAGLLVVLHEDQVPVLQEALVLAAREVIGGAELHPAVDVELRAGAAGAGGAALPEVLRARAFHDPLAGHAELEPAVDRLLIGVQPKTLVAGEDRHPDVALGEAEHVAGELPGEGDGLALEVVAEGEVAEHLKEGEVPGGVADVVDVNRAKDLLAVGQPRRGGLLLSEEVGLQRVHPGDSEQRRGIVSGGHQGRRGDASVATLLEEAQKALAYLVGGHPARRS